MRYVQVVVLGKSIVCYATGMATLYRILRRADWDAACAQGVFPGTAHDRRDGYIHLSAAHQVEETAAKHYAGLTDLVLLYVREDALALPEGALRWEAARGGDQFPHFYAELSASAVHRVEALPLGASDRHVFPSMDD